MPGMNMLLTSYLALCGCHCVFALVTGLSLLLLMNTQDRHQFITVLQHFALGLVGVPYTRVSQGAQKVGMV